MFTTFLREIYTNPERQGTYLEQYNGKYYSIDNNVKPLFRKFKFTPDKLVAKYLVFELLNEKKDQEKPVLSLDFIVENRKELDTLFLLFFDINDDANVFREQIEKPLRKIFEGF